MLIRRSTVLQHAQTKHRRSDNSIESKMSMSKSQSISLLQKPKKKNPTHQAIENVMEGWIYQTIMSIVTVYILFADDIKNCATQASADTPFSIICAILMVVFITELVLSSIALDDYVLGFYFWLDLVSIITMLLDIHWFYSFFINQVSGMEKKAKTITSIVKAGKSAKVAARTIRILRIIRIVRLVRISKLYKAKEKLILKEEMKQQKLQNQSATERKRSSIHSYPSLSNNMTEEVIPPQESKIGKMLSDMTTKRVIIIIIAMMIGIILFNSNFYFQPNSSMNFGMKVFSNFTSFNDPHLNLTFNVYIREHSELDNPVIFAQVGYLYYSTIEYNSTVFRDEETGIYSGDCHNLLPYDTNNSVCYAIFDLRYGNRIASVLNIVKTVFISAVLALGTYFFSKDTTELVLEPIEAIVENLKQITKNPLQAMIKAEKDEIQELILQEEEKTSLLQNCFNCNIGGQKGKQMLETLILQKTIRKIGTLLALGFGEAGSEIISKNMLKNNGGEINPFLPGKQTIGIFSVVSINNFHLISSVLENDIIDFINCIAQIIHEVTSEHCGSVSRTMGDSFLLVWKFDKQYQNEKGTQLYSCDNVNQMTDLALITYIKITERINCSAKIEQYIKHKGFGFSFSFLLTFSYDIGWTIEGAIGSPSKIDVGYISPYVQRAYYLVKKASKYNVDVIMSDKFVEMLTDNAQISCRIVDIIEAKSEIDDDSSKEIGLYTFDLEPSMIKNRANSFTDYFKKDELLKGNKSTLKIAKFRKKERRRENFKAINAENIKVKFFSTLQRKDENYRAMRTKYSQKFLDLYNEAFDEFYFGDWSISKGKFEELIELYGQDSPSNYIMKYMAKFNYQKPNSEI